MGRMEAKSKKVCLSAKLVSFAALSLSLTAMGATPSRKANLKAAPAKVAGERKVASETGSFATSGRAAPQMSGMTSAATTGSRLSELVRGRLSLGGALNAASTLASDDISFSAAGGTNVRGGLDLNSTSALAVTAQYVVPVQQLPLEAMVGMTAENTRSIESASGALRGSLSSPPTFQPWILNVGAAYKVIEKVSLPVNLNYTLLNFVRAGDPFQEFTMTPQVGFQYGVNFKLAPQLIAEILQRDVRYNVWARGDGFKIDAGTTRMAGLNLSVRYLF